MDDCLQLAFPAPNPQKESRSFFSCVPDDVLLNILFRLEEYPSDLARLDCVCTRFSDVIRTTCWKLKCLRTVPAVVADLLQRPNTHAGRFSEPPGGWASLQKLLVCCPGLKHAGVLLENWDFGLDRELGWFEIDGSELPYTTSFADGVTFDRKTESKGIVLAQETQGKGNEEIETRQASGSGAWFSLSERVEERDIVVDAHCNTVDGSPYETEQISECKDSNSFSSVTESHRILRDTNRAKVTGKRKASCERVDAGKYVVQNVEVESVKPLGMENKGKRSHKVSKRRRTHYHSLSHLSREQGNKLLANRFRADSLYICDWPGCIHPGEKRTYKLFRGVFKNFKNTHVWRNLKDMKAKTSSVGCAFCPCKSTWDMVTTFCLKRSIEYHDDGEPVVRAFVCENGHVAGSWTDRPMYNL